MYIYIYICIYIHDIKSVTYTPYVIRLFVQFPMTQFPLLSSPHL